MLTESAKQPCAKVPHIKFCEHINHVYKTNGIISTYDHIDGKLHCIDIDANKNGQNLTFQVKIMQLKAANEKKEWHRSKAKNKDGHKKIMYVPLSFKFSNLLFVVCDTFQEVHLWPYITQAFKPF